MVKAVWAILKHYSSTLENPDHGDCPHSVSSWCSYNRDIATGESSHRPIKNALRPAVMEVIKPLFSRLASTTFLVTVKDCYTQNPCESLNHLVWSLAPKEQYTSPQETSLAVSLAACVYNNGLNQTLSSMINKCGLRCKSNMKRIWKRLDHERALRADYRQREEVRLKRKKSKRNKCQKQDAFLHVEGTQYKSQQFHS